MTIHLKQLLLVNMFENTKDLNQVSVFLLADFTNRNNMCLYSKLLLNGSSNLIFFERSFILNFTVLH